MLSSYEAGAVATSFIGGSTSKKSSRDEKRRVGRKPSTENDSEDRHVQVSILRRKRNTTRYETEDPELTRGLSASSLVEVVIPKADPCCGNCRGLTDSDATALKVDLELMQ